MPFTRVAHVGANQVAQKKVCKAIYAFKSDTPGDLHFNKGDILMVVEYSKAWWKGFNMVNPSVIGLFPYNYVADVNDKSTENIPQAPDRNQEGDFSPSALAKSVWKSNEEMQAAYEREVAEHKKDVENLKTTIQVLSADSHALNTDLNVEQAKKGPGALPEVEEALHMEIDQLSKDLDLWKKTAQDAQTEVTQLTVRLNAGVGVGPPPPPPGGPGKGHGTGKGKDAGKGKAAPGSPDGTPPGPPPPPPGGPLVVKWKGDGKGNGKNTGKGKDAGKDKANGKGKGKGRDNGKGNGKGMGKGKGPPPPPPGTGGKGKGAPPPPDGGGFGAAPARVAKYKPNVKTLTFTAAKLPNRAVEGTLWEHADADITLDVDEIEMLFEKKKISLEKKVGVEMHEKKADVFQLLDPKRENNCGIKMASIKVPHEAVLDSLLRIDAGLLTVDGDGQSDAALDMVELLQACSPTVEEAKILTMHEEEPHGPSQGMDHCSKVDQFFYTLTAIEGSLEERLKCMMFMLTLTDRVAIAQSHADEKEVAAKAVLGSLDPKGATGHLIFILTMVLELGNFLNAGTRWANAGGYKLESLLKLADTRAPNSPPDGPRLTLAHIIVMNCYKHKPEALDIFEELHACSKAFAYPYDQLMGDIAKLHADINFMKKAADRAPKDMDGDEMGPKVTAFAQALQPGIAKCSESVKSMSVDMGKVCTLFGEADKPKSYDEMLQKITTFCNLLKFAKDELDHDKDEKKKAAEKKRKALARTNSGGAGLGHDTPGVPPAMPARNAVMGAVMGDLNKALGRRARNQTSFS